MDLDQRKCGFSLGIRCQHLEKNEAEESKEYEEEKVIDEDEEFR